MKTFFVEIPLTQFSTIPKFQYSKREQSELTLSLFGRIRLDEKGHAIRELGHSPQKQAPFGDKHGMAHFSSPDGIDGMAHKGYSSGYVSLSRRKPWHTMPQDKFIDLTLIDLLSQCR